MSVCAYYAIPPLLSVCRPPPGPRIDVQAGDSVVETTNNTVSMEWFSIPKTVSDD